MTVVPPTKSHVPLNAVRDTPIFHSSDDVLRMVPFPEIGTVGGVAVLNTNTPVASANVTDASVLNSPMSASVTVTVSSDATVNVSPGVYVAAQDRAARHIAAKGKTDLDFIPSLLVGVYYTTNHPFVQAL